MQFKQRTLDQIADMICGNFDSEKSLFVYRSSSYLTKFFQDCDTDYRHDGSTRNRWVADTLRNILTEPSSTPTSPPDTFLRVVRTLMDQADALHEGPDRTGALSQLNVALAREGFEAFYAEDKQCYLRHIATKTVVTSLVNPHRPFSAVERLARDQLVAYLNQASEDELIEHILLPLFRHLGFQRITSAGHKDKALEYGKDIWMKFILPTTHVLYFGIQAKKGKVDAAGDSRNANVAELHNQVTMMLGHEIFDPEIGKRVLVDHAFIIAGGEITKAARNWLGNKLDATRRSQVLFMDRDDILDLFIVSKVPMPENAVQEKDDGIPL